MRRGKRVRVIRVRERKKEVVEVGGEECETVEKLHPSTSERRISELRSSLHSRERTHVLQIRERRQTRTHKRKSSFLPLSCSWCTSFLSCKEKGGGTSQPQLGYEEADFAAGGSIRFHGFSGPYGSRYGGASGSGLALDTALAVAAATDG